MVAEIQLFMLQEPEIEPEPVFCIFYRPQTEPFSEARFKV